MKFKKDDIVVITKRFPIRHVRHESSVYDSLGLRCQIIEFQGYRIRNEWLVHIPDLESNKIIHEDDLELESTYKSPLYQALA